MNVLDFWMKNPGMWFNSSPEDDMAIKAKFEEYTPEPNTLDEIIFHDQIMRHIARANGVDYDRDNLIIALTTFKNIRGNYTSASDPRHLMFLYLPFRHTFVTENLMLCLEMFTMFHRENPSPYFLRFIKATIRAISSQTYPVPLVGPADEWSRDIFDSDDFDVDYPVKLCEQGRAYRRMIKFPSHKNKVLISLSGGVDSMICAYLAARVHEFETFAVFINYNNREEGKSGDETNFIRMYCNQLGIKLYTREITEVNKTFEDREFYEEHTRKIRFDAYKHIAEIMCPGEWEKVPVVLGHNDDDAVENVFRNVADRKKYDCLIGMTSESTVHGVRLCRPLIKKDKTFIWKFAFDHNIPYLRNSTPPKCRRGVLRNEIIPHVPDDVQTGLVALSDVVSELYEFMQEKVEAVEITRRNCPHGINYQYFTNRKVPDSVMFWKMMFQRISKMSGYKFYISNKSLNGFVALMKKKTLFSIGNGARDEFKFILRKDIVAHFNVRNRGTSITFTHNQ